MFVRSWLAISWRRGFLRHSTMRMGHCTSGLGPLNEIILVSCSCILFLYLIYRTGSCFFLFCARDHCDTPALCTLTRSADCPLPLAAAWLLLAAAPPTDCPADAGARSPPSTVSPCCPQHAPVCPYRLAVLVHAPASPARSLSRARARARIPDRTPRPWPPLPHVPVSPPSPAPAGNVCIPLLVEDDIGLYIHLFELWIPYSPGGGAVVHISIMQPSLDFGPKLLLRCASRMSLLAWYPNRRKWCVGALYEIPLPLASRFGLSYTCSIS